MIAYLDIVGGISGECGDRYRAFSEYRHARKRLAQRLSLLGRKLRCRQGFDLVVSDSSEGWKIGDRAEIAAQRLQSR